MCKVANSCDTTKQSALKDAEKFALFCPAVIPVWRCTLHIIIIYILCDIASNTAAKVAQSFEMCKYFSSLPYNRIGDKHESSGVAFLFRWADKRDLPIRTYLMLGKQRSGLPCVGRSLLCLRLQPFYSASCLRNRCVEVFPSATIRKR